jgi:hypothetical protein
MTKGKHKKLFVVMRGNRLVLDLSHAKTPGVITLDTTKLAVAYFQAVAGAEGAKVLGYSNEAGVFTPLATFASADDADAMRDQIVHALMYRGRALNRLRKLAIVLAIVFAGLFVLNELLLALAPTRSPMDAAIEQSGSGQDVPAVPGAPVDADAFLKGG